MSITALEARDALAQISISITAEVNKLEKLVDQLDADAAGAGNAMTMSVEDCLDLIDKIYVVVNEDLARVIGFFTTQAVVVG
jgi:hypothetical protein